MSHYSGRVRSWPGKGSLADPGEARDGPRYPGVPARKLWFVRAAATRPWRVCLLSMCSACLLTGIMVVGLLTGTFEFALDTSPSSFKVTYYPIADRGDALWALLHLPSY